MPTTQVVVSFGASVLALLGGGGVVLIAICGFLSKFIADRTIESHKASLNIELERVKSQLANETEGHKLKLRKAELLFERELSATVEFSALYRRILPNYSRPDMDWHDACDVVAARFESIEKDLVAFVTKHGAVLTGDIRAKLSECITYAAQNKFGTYATPDDRADATENAAAGKLLDLLQVVEIHLFEMVKNEGRSR